MNFATKTITITKAFAAMAMKPNSEEANLLTHLRAICPEVSTTSPAGGLRWPLQGHFVIPPKGGLANHFLLLLVAA